ncbi:acyltransferase [Mucilaginibacter ginkgonis]|uniref:Acyltransferase n=1 Tax=Mucilaginibacter ginkgonis TaxID=2682091 RepID=A0A6I4HW55_9SPHI|nr:acyltransferase [Mucilaginibacter ginkgonis]QQL50199.1 acyltransferase [Mucilaginibacter ginkgonis]
MSKYKKEIKAWILRVLKRYTQQKVFEKLKNGNVILAPGLLIDDYFNIELPAETYSLNIGSDVIFRKFCSIAIHQHGSLIIGNKVFFNNYCSVSCLGEIKIGENTLLGEGVKLYDHNHEYHYQNNNLTIEREKFKKGFIKIGKNCWIGSNVTILNNVEIGDNVIIGANTLVYKSIPPSVIVRSQADLLITALNEK